MSNSWGTRNSRWPIFRLFLVVTLVVVFVGVEGTWAQEKVTDFPKATISKSTTEEIVLEIRVPELGMETVDAGGQLCQRILLDGYGQIDLAGAPALPQWGVMLGIPPDAQPKVTILDAQSETLDGIQVCPAPTLVFDTPLPDSESVEDLASYRREYVSDSNIYAVEAAYPVEAAEMGQTGYLRDQRYLQLLVHPVQYNPVRGEIIYHDYLKIKISFDRPTGQPVQSSPRLESSSFEGVLRHSILNYESAKEWRTRPTLDVNAFDPQLPQQGGASYRLGIGETGIYQLSYSYLRDAGLPVDDIDPHTFKLDNTGQEVGIYVVGEADGVFDSSDYILFYGEQLVTKYTRTNIYWLTYGGAKGLRMVEVDGTLSGTAPVPSEFLASVHLEEDTSHVPWTPGDADTDRWMWHYVYPPSTPHQDHQVMLSNIATGSFSATLRVALLGGLDYAQNPDHHAKVYVNGYDVADVTWDGITWYLVDADFDQAYLVDGENTIRVEGPNDTGAGIDFFYIDWLELDYWDTYRAESDGLFFGPDRTDPLEYHVSDFGSGDIHTFDVTEAFSPSRIISTTLEQTGSIYTLKFEAQAAQVEGSMYVALVADQFFTPDDIVLDTPSDLHSTSNGADYIIITHEDFRAAVGPLADHRQSKGLRTVVVDLQDIFDEFSYGVYDPNAIHDFLAYAYGNWVTPAPSYVLLVGDGHYDYNDNLNLDFPQYIPPYLAPIDVGDYETATDNYYVRFDEDILPDMHIGRFPVNSEAEATVMVNKAIGYEISPPDTGGVATFVADNIPDPAGNFEALSDDLIANYFPPSYTADRVYMTDYCGPPTNPATQCSAGAQAVIDSINNGPLLVNWIGHSARYFWANEQILHVDTLSQLTNGDALPVVLPMTCYDGQFHISDSLRPSGLGESIVRMSGGGAVASWSSTGKGYVRGHHYLEEGLLTALFTEDVKELGVAVYLGKLNLFNSTAVYNDLIHTYHLFGDPALRMDTIDTQAVTVSPGVSSTLVHTNSEGNAIAVEIPEGAVTEKTTIVITALPVPSQGSPTDLKFGGQALTLEAYREGTLLLDFTFEVPVSITVKYSDADIGWVYEDSLVLNYWDGSAGQWVDAASTCIPASTYERRPDKNWLMAPICPTGEFALFGIGKPVLHSYLPAVFKSYPPVP